MYIYIWQELVLDLRNLRRRAIKVEVNAAFSLRKFSCLEYFNVSVLCMSLWVSDVSGWRRLWWCTGRYQVCFLLSTWGLLYSSLLQLTTVFWRAKVPQTLTVACHKRLILFCRIKIYANSATYATVRYWRNKDATTVCCRLYLCFICPLLSAYKWHHTESIAWASRYQSNRGSFGPALVYTGCINAGN